MGEIQEIMRQFNQGQGEWKLFLKSVKISNIHGWYNQEILFNFPVVAIVGENGIGKSTFLKAAVCAYDNKNGKNFYPSKMFVNTQWDLSGIAGATIEYKIRQGNEDRELRWRKTNDWGYKPKGKKPKRNVYFLDISRTLPLDATAGYAKIAQLANMESDHEVLLNDESIENLSYVLGQSYSHARFIGANVSREVGLLTKEYGEISQFHQGAGEDSMLDMFKLLQDIPEQSLLVIDEVENSLHPQAQRRFVRYLLKLSRVRKLQIIMSTHSPFILEELPDIGRVMLVRLSDRKDVIYGVSSEFALSTIDDKLHPELFVYLEDEEAVSLFWEILKRDNSKYDMFCKKISTKYVGSCSVVDTLDRLGKDNKLPYKSLAIIDGDKKITYPNCLSLPGNVAPERRVFQDLKNLNWNKLDDRFGIGAGTLFKYLDDAMLITDHHKWTTYVGDNIKRSKDYVWDIMIEEWNKQCLSDEMASDFIQKVIEALE